MEAVVGRDDEIAELDGIVQSARRGRGRVVVVRGEPGIGKTTLLDALAAKASDCTVLRTSGCEAERALTYAALHALLGPVLPIHGRLPEAQRRAVGAAFGLVDGLPVDRFLLSLGVLSLLCIAAEDRPVVVVVDDAHLVDDGTLAVLSFVARRLDVDGIAIAFALRDDRPSGPLAGLPELSVAGLSEVAVADVLRATSGQDVDAAVVDHLHAATGGSPLAIIEMGGLLSAHQLDGRAELPSPLPIGRRLEAHVDDIVRSLPAASRLLLLVAAAGAAPVDQAYVHAAAAELGALPDGLAPAERARLLWLDPRPRFRHPLVRSVIYAGAPDEERRLAHGALAASADAAGDTIRAAWHGGLAASGPDEAVAARLDAVADDVLARGGCGTAAAFRLRATELTPARTRRIERGLAAAENLLLSGSASRARELLAELAPSSEDPRQHALTQRVHGQVRYAAGDVHDTVSMLVAAAEALSHIDRSLARDTLLDALSAAHLAGSSPRRGEHPADVARVARSMPVDVDAEPSLADQLLDAFAAVHLDGAAWARPQLLTASAAIDASGDALDQRGRPTEQLRWLGLGCYAASAVANDTDLLRLGRRIEALARPHGALAALAVALLHLALVRLARGSLPDARAHLAERASLQSAMGWPPDIGDLVCHAWAGDIDRTRAETVRIAAQAQASGHHWMLVFSDYATSVLELGHGRYSAALEPAQRTYWENPSLALVAFPNIVEAAIRCDAPDLAADAASDLRQRVGDEPTPLVSALLDTTTALCSGPRAAEPYFEAALRHLPWAHGTVHGRISLLYGEWLRRRKRKLDAREQLRAAHSSLAAAGASAFAVRARRELAAAGERAARADDGHPLRLTAQETQIARLATTGATNVEIAAQLFLSSSTVDYHLRKVFRKLGVTSRRQLVGMGELRENDDLDA